MSKIYKLIVTDFDGTLLTDDKKITNETKSYLKKLKNNNYYIIGATARTLNSVKQNIDINIFDYLILNNGANLYDVKNNDIIYSKIIPFDTCFDIVKSVKKYNVGMDFCSATSYYKYNLRETERLNFIFHITDIKELKKQEIVKINMFSSNVNTLFQIKKIIDKKYRNVICFIMQEDKCRYKRLVVLPCSLNKKETLITLCNELGLNINEAIFFGDSNNDIELIESSGCGVAMKNAIGEVKICAKYITDYDNNHNGVVNFLKENLPEMNKD